MINDDILNQYAIDCAEEIALAIKHNLADEEREIHEYADGSEWVIYPAKARALCDNCNITQGEIFFSNCHEPMNDGFNHNEVAVTIAYGELRYRIKWALEHLSDKRDEEREAIFNHWQGESVRGRAHLCREAGESIFAARRDYPSKEMLNYLSMMELQ